MTEVELKVSVLQAQEDGLLVRLTELGFLPRGRVYERDVYFNAPDRDFRKTDEALRLRSVDGRALITYKGAKQDDRSSTRAELETGVQSEETAQRLLEALGYQAVFTVHKSRWIFVRGTVTACLDHVQGLGAHLELETLLEDEVNRDAAVDELMALLSPLGLSADALTRKSYLELLMASATV